MKDESAHPRRSRRRHRAPGLPAAVDRAAFQAELDALRVREKAHTQEGDAIAAARRRLPMVEVDASISLTGPRGPLTLLDAFEGRRQLIAYYFMWHTGHPLPSSARVARGLPLRSASCPTCTPRHHLRRLCQGPYDESARYRDFMGWTCPGTRPGSLDALLTGRRSGMFHLVCYLREGDRVFETYWTNRRGAEAMDYSYALMDLTVYGRQEPWEDSPSGWPQQCPTRGPTAVPPDWPPVSKWPGGRPIAQWSRLEAGHPEPHPVSVALTTGASWGPGREITSQSAGLGRWGLPDLQQTAANAGRMVWPLSSAT